MRTCRVDFAPSTHYEPQSYPDAYAGVGRAGELVIMREVVETIDGQPHHKAETLYVFAPGTWFSVTYEDSAT